MSGLSHAVIYVNKIYYTVVSSLQEFLNFLFNVFICVNEA